MNKIKKNRSIKSRTFRTYSPIDLIIGKATIKLHISLIKQLLVILKT